MKRTTTFLTYILLLTGFNANSQTLNNTTWTVYDGNSIFFYYFHFSTDTLSYSSNNFSYTPQSHFYENGDTITIIDLSGPCPPFWTGMYSFLIQNDTLKFTLISDSCLTRAITLTDYYWVALLTGIEAINPLKQIQIFPNPFSERLNIWNNNNEPNEIIIYDIASKRILEQKFINFVSLNTEQLVKGLYLYEVRDKNGLCRKGKVVKD
ncbi:MAG TPA: T9SS type A sorting domain-containing protein [Bacteroidia bacterium]|nr:T9SS type A sorting domain-containing protein [Bacteroidia bacterium]